MKICGDMATNGDERRVNFRARHGDLNDSCSGRDFLDEITLVLDADGESRTYLYLTMSGMEAELLADILVQQAEKIRSHSRKNNP